MTIRNPHLTDEERDRRRVWQVIGQWRFRPPAAPVMWQEIEDMMVALMGEVRMELKECRSQEQALFPRSTVATAATKPVLTLSRN